MIRPSLLATLLGLALLSSCRSPSPAVTFHTLRSIALEEAKWAPAEKPLALEIMPVQLPELLQRSQIVVLEGQDSHRLAATHRWGNTLEKDMQRVLVENLSAILGSDAVVPYPLGDRVQAIYQISLDVQQCDGAPNGTLQFRATWMVTQPGGGKLLFLGRLNLQEPVHGGNIEDLVSAHSRVMNSLSQAIAKELQALNSRGT